MSLNVMKQLTEIWRRGIVVPLSAQRADEMASFHVSSEEDVEYLEIKDDSFFDSLWGTNLFQDINRKCGSLIDDYEEEVLAPEALIGVLGVVTKHMLHLREPRITLFLEKFGAMVKRAIDLGYPVYFIL